MTSEQIKTTNRRVQLACGFGFGVALATFTGFGLPVAIAAGCCWSVFFAATFGS